MPRSLGLPQNVAAALDMLAWSELGAALLKASDDGYNVIVGSTPAAPILFDDYSTHPNKLVEIKPGLKSTAAGRYQLLNRWYAPYKELLHLPDFSPVSQDKIAIQQIKERGAYMPIIGGNIALAIGRCSNIWASLPGNDYGQHQQKIELLIAAYQRAGGTVAA